MNACGIIISLALLGAVPEEPVQKTETSMGIGEEWQRLFNSQTKEMGILTGELTSLRERIREHDGLIIQINKNLLGVQHNIGQQIQESCPYMKNRNYIDIALGGLSLIGVIAIYNWGAGFFRRNKNASVSV